MKATRARQRAWKASATAGFTLVASAVMMAGPAAAHADSVPANINGPVCEEVTVWSFVTPTVSTPPLCVTNEGLPYNCATPHLDAPGTAGVDTEVCVID